MTKTEQEGARHGLRLRDRPEFSRKTAPLTLAADAMQRAKHIFSHRYLRSSSAQMDMCQCAKQI